MRGLPLLGLTALLLCAAGAAYAASTPAKGKAVDPELLEFLADWQGADGNWVDPMTFTRLDPSKVKPQPRHGTPVPPPGPASAAPASAGDAR